MRDVCCDEAIRWKLHVLDREFWSGNIKMGIGVLYGENGGQCNSQAFCCTKIENSFSERMTS